MKFGFRWYRGSLVESRTCPAYSGTQAAAHVHDNPAQPVCRKEFVHSNLNCSETETEILLCLRNKVVVVNSLGREVELSPRTG